MDSIAKAERAERDLDTFIERRDTHRRQTEGERLEEELWAESVRAHNLKRELALRSAWADFHLEQADRAEANGRLIAARHRAAAEELLGTEQANGHKREESA